jgi:hypothetical protein
MIKWFLHPKTKEKLLVKDCLDKGLLSDFFPLAYLHICAEEREWKGKASTTQLLDGSRMSYLKLLTPYAIDPNDSAFRVLGTKSHAKLEKLTPKKSFTELSIPETDISGIADLLEQQSNGEWWLTDYKTSGAYVVRKALGLVKKKRPAFDENGNPILYVKGGKWGKVGDQKLEDYWEVDENQKDIKNYKLQLNKYRKEIEEYFGIIISGLKIFFIVRDGGIKASLDNGISQKTYFIDISFMDNEEVDKYFNTKNDLLLKALDNYNNAEEEINPELEYKEKALFKFMPDPCNAEESWQGRRCNGYCPVSEVCQKTGCPYLKGD